MSARDIIRDRELHDLIEGLHGTAGVLAALENGEPPDGLGMRSAAVTIRMTIQTLTDYRLALHLKGHGAASTF